MTSIKDINVEKSTVETKADQYFANLNPLAKKIHLDVCEVTEAYADLWKNFSIKERNEVINETLIKPEFIVKYMDEVLCNSPQQIYDRRAKKSGMNSVSFDDDDNTSVLSSDSSSESSINNIIPKYLFDDKHMHTYARLLTGQKKIHDDTCGIYLDEHSSPFSFKSKSQINLNLFDYDKSISNSTTKTNEIIALKTIKTKSKHSLLEPFDSNIGSNKPSKSKSKKKSSSKHSLASSINSSNSRKNFMSKLFSGLAHGTTDSNTLVSQNDEEKETLFSANTIANDTSDVSLLDMINADQCLQIGISNGSRNHGPMSNNATDEENDEEKQNCEFKSLLPNDDITKDYDFLNNW